MVFAAAISAYRSIFAPTAGGTLYNTKRTGAFFQIQRPVRNFFAAVFPLPRKQAIKQKKVLQMQNLFGDPTGNRTRVTAVKGRCLDRLTNGPYKNTKFS